MKNYAQTSHMFPPFLRIAVAVTLIFGLLFGFGSPLIGMTICAAGLPFLFEALGRGNTPAEPDAETEPDETEPLERLGY